MTKYDVIFAPEALTQLISLEKYIAQASASSSIAARYIDELVDFCEGFCIAPERGAPRYDLLTGLRIVGYRKHTNIAIVVDFPRHTVAIVGIFHGGQSYEAALKN